MIVLFRTHAVIHRTKIDEEGRRKWNPCYVQFMGNFSSQLLLVGGIWFSQFDLVLSHRIHRANQQMVKMIFFSKFRSLSNIYFKYEHYLLYFFLPNSECLPNIFAAPPVPSASAYSIAPNNTLMLYQTDNLAIFSS